MMATSKSVLIGLLLLASTLPLQSMETQEPPQQLIREVVYNELRDHALHGYWQYLVEKRVGERMMAEQRIETKDGPVYRVLAINGNSLSSKDKREEEERLERLLANPEQQHHLKRQYDEDEQRIGRILKLLPDAFLYDYLPENTDCYRLNFRPNPSFHPQGIEARIFHSMGGTIWISKSTKHLVRLKGSLIEDIEFGFGLLGKLNKGGWFDLERVQVSSTDWKTSRLEVRMTGKAIFFKTIAKDTHEVRSNFREVLRDLSIAQAKVVLDQQRAEVPAYSSRTSVQSSLVSFHK